MATDFEEQDDILVRIDRTWRSLNTNEIRLLLLEAKSEIRSLRALNKRLDRLHTDAMAEVLRCHTREGNMG